MIAQETDGNYSDLIASHIFCCCSHLLSSFSNSSDRATGEEGNCYEQTPEFLHFLPPFASSSIYKLFYDKL